MARQRSGMVFQRGKGIWYARVSYTDQFGKRRYLKRRAESKTDAKDIVRQLLRELEDYGEEAVQGAHMTFSALADYYEKTYLIEPQYVDGRKVAGLRSHYAQKLFLKTLRDYFGKRKLRSISVGDLQAFKAKRLATPKKAKRKQGGTGKEGQRAIASVNRELALLRRMLNVARQEGWILKNPFSSGDVIISAADERGRQRIITRGEEGRLLAACEGQRAHLKPILLCALDTGMRRGEILKLKWADVDFADSAITVRAFNTKTMQERHLAMPERLRKALEAVYELSTKDPDALCFGIVDNVKKSFNTVRKAAGLPDVRFHDLRHTVASRLVSLHMPLSEVGRILGHTRPETTYRYVNANVETAQRAAAILDAFNEPQQESGDRELVN